MRLTKRRKYDKLSFAVREAVNRNASIAQSVEQLIRNQQVVCSSHITSFFESPDIAKR